MKRSIALALATLMIVSAIFAISAFATSTDGVKLGLGHVVRINKSKPAAADAAGTAQVDAMFCAAAFDAEGNILSVRYDTAQTKVGFDAAGQLQGDLEALQATKRDLGDEYGMKKASGIQKDWYEQVNGLESWMVGKNVQDVLGMEQADGKATDADLTTMVTVSIGDFLTALENAYNDAMSK